MVSCVVTPVDASSNRKANLRPSDREACSNACHRARQARTLHRMFGAKCRCAYFRFCDESRRLHHGSDRLGHLHTTDVSCHFPKLYLWKAVHHAWPKSTTNIAWSIPYKPRRRLPAHALLPHLAGSMSRTLRLEAHRYSRLLLGSFARNPAPPWPYAGVRSSRSWLRGARLLSNNCSFDTTAKRGQSPITSGSISTVAMYSKWGRTYSSVC